MAERHDAEVYRRKNPLRYVDPNGETDTVSTSRADDRYFFSNTATTRGSEAACTAISLDQSW